MKKLSQAFLTLMVGVCPIAGCHPQAQASGDVGGSDAPILTQAPRPEIPQTPAGQRLAWLLSALEGDPSQLSNQALEEAFTSRFLQSLPPDHLRYVLAETAARGLVLEKFEGASTESSLTAILTDANGDYVRLNLAVSLEESDRISGLLLNAAGDLDPRLDTEKELREALSSGTWKFNYLEADISEGSCAPVRAIHADESLPLGSTFKLYVLAALAKDVQSGTRQWDAPLAIRDEWKSLPSGVMQNLPVGQELPLRTYAQEMIRISDNTATDHLLHTMGREHVEATLPEMGHEHAGQNRPFFSTRELFTLKLMLTPEEQRSFIAADEPTRRSLLATYSARDPREWNGELWEKPILVDQLEWFASPMDLCRLLVKLREFGQTPATAPVGEILAMNPGGAPSPGSFDYVGFKGGSEPGVLNTTWLVRRKSDGGWRVVTLGFMERDRPLDTFRAQYLALAARQLAARGHSAD